MIRVSVVVPFFNSAATLAGCLRALAGQSLEREAFEVIAVDDGSTDGGGKGVEAFGARLIRQENRGAPAARNTGIRAAEGDWVAFTDADCMPSRGWLKNLLAAVDSAPQDSSVLGAAGSTTGLGSESPPARFVDLVGGLDAKQHLSHPLFPFAPSGNLMYRRDALTTVGGFDERFDAYDACDLHTRLVRAMGGRLVFSPRAVVLHIHRSDWGSFWRQQKGYGHGMAQFYLAHCEEVDWGLPQEALAWLRVAAAGCRSLQPWGSRDERLVWRGRFVKQAAQRTGFIRSYWSAEERGRW